MIKFKSFEQVSAPTKGQHFDYLVPDYIYNKDTKLLSEAPQKRDIYEEINSYSNTSLDAILDKYSSLSDVDTSLPVQQRQNSDLAIIGESFEKAELYRESRGLSSDLSLKQIYEIMLEESQKLDNNLKQGGEKNEKKAQIDEKSE